jgi:hypothetical protein
MFISTVKRLRIARGSEANTPGMWNLLDSSLYTSNIPLRWQRICINQFCIWMNRISSNQSSVWQLSIFALFVIWRACKWESVSKLCVFFIPEKTDRSDYHCVYTHADVSHGIEPSGRICVCESILLICFKEPMHLLVYRFLIIMKLTAERLCDNFTASRGPEKSRLWRGSCWKGCSWLPFFFSWNGRLMYPPLVSQLAKKHLDNWRPSVVHMFYLRW